MCNYNKVQRAWICIVCVMHNYVHMVCACPQAATGSSGVGGGGGGAGGSGSELGGSFSLDDSLVDNLLNFAGTPKVPL